MRANNSCLRGQDGEAQMMYVLAKSMAIRVCAERLQLIRGERIDPQNRPSCRCTEGQCESQAQGGVGQAFFSVLTKILEV